MAQATTIRFGQFKVYIADPDALEGSPPALVYTAPCGFTSRALSRSKNLAETEVPDCDDEDAPAWVQRDVRSMSFSVSGEGVLARESVEMWDRFAAAGGSWPVRVVADYGGAVGEVTYEGRAHLADFTLTANRGERVTAQVDLQSDGALIRDPALNGD